MGDVQFLLSIIEYHLRIYDIASSVGCTSKIRDRWQMADESVFEDNQRTSHHSHSSLSVSLCAGKHGPIWPQTTGFSVFGLGSRFGSTRFLFEPRWTKLRTTLKLMLFLGWGCCYAILNIVLKTVSPNTAPEIPTIEWREKNFAFLQSRFVANITFIHSVLFKQIQSSAGWCIWGFHGVSINGGTPK